MPNYRKKNDAAASPNTIRHRARQVLANEALTRASLLSQQQNGVTGGVNGSNGGSENDGQSVGGGNGRADGTIIHGGEDSRNDVDDKSSDGSASFYPEDDGSVQSSLGFPPSDDSEDEEPIHPPPPEEDGAMAIDGIEVVAGGDVEGAAAAGTSPFVTGAAHVDPEELPPVHQNEEDFTVMEEASLELLLLCDDSGARRGFYDELLTLLRRFRKYRVDITKASGRESLVKALEKKVSVPKPVVEKVHGRDVVYFPFIESLRDLLRSNVFDDINNLCANRESDKRFDRFVPVTQEDFGEIMARRWAKETQDEIERLDDYNPDLDLLFGLMMYGDKTGTDVYQRYPLEPQMWTSILLSLAARRNPSTWRHLGFIPSQECVPSQLNGEQDGNAALTSEEKLQQYHDFLSIMLRDTKHASDNPPLMWVNLGGVWQKRRLRVKLCVVSADQLAQDYFCGRMSSNGGSAARIHRGCMASAVHSFATFRLDGTVSLTGNGCCHKPPTEALQRLNELALIQVPHMRRPSREIQAAVEYLVRVKKLAKDILNKTFSMHPHRSAFDGMDFGSNKHGILVATMDDHLHSCESGILFNVAEVAYHGLTPSELTCLEKVVRSVLAGGRSSISKDYPLRARTKNGFGRLTLSTHKEKVSFVFYLLLALHTREGRKILQDGHKRQRDKYLTFPTIRDVKTSERPKKRSSKRSASKRKKQKVSVDDAHDVDTEVEDVDPEEEDEGTLVEEESTDSARLSATAFPYRKDLLFGSDHGSTNIFKRTDDDIEFICTHLQRHGLGFLLDLKLDSFQLDTLMIASNATLHKMTKPSNRYPTRESVEDIDAFQDLLNLFAPCADDDSGEDDDDTSQDTAIPSTVERDCKRILPRMLPSRVIDQSKTLNGQVATQTTNVKYQMSFNIPGCTAKHRRKKPKVKGTGNTGAILSDMSTFASFVEFMLCYHAWCHHSRELPQELQEDLELISFAPRLVVRYFDTILYRGDDTVDAETCKVHTQLHQNFDLFGDPMQYCTETGESGLKVWAKGMSKTALKHGREKFTRSTGERVAERMLLNAALERVEKKRGAQENSPPCNTTISFHRRRLPHFRLSKTRTGTQLTALNRHGKESPTDKQTGAIQSEILEAILLLEKVTVTETSIDIWCEAELPNGNHIRCWPQYRKQEGPWYDWAMMKWEIAVEGTDSVYKEYPGKVLALYEDSEGNLKALVHSTHHKSTKGVEGPFGDSRLVTHYRLQFNSGGNPMLYAIPFENVIECIVAYESKLYAQPLVPRVASAQRRNEHTVMVILPKREWAKLFLTWAKELKERHEQSGNSRNKYRLDIRP